MSAPSSREILTHRVDLLQKDLEDCRKAKEKYYQMLESSSEGFMLLDGDFAITEVNRALLKISGYQPGDFIGHKIDTFYDKKSMKLCSATQPAVKYPCYSAAAPSRTTTLARTATCFFWPI